MNIPYPGEYDLFLAKKMTYYSQYRCESGIVIAVFRRDVAQLGLARLTGGQKVVSSNLTIPTIFSALFELKLSLLNKIHDS